MPVSLDGQIAVPSVLGGYTRFQLSEIGFKTPKSDYENLYRLLTRQPGTPKAPVGEIHRLPALPEQSRVTDFGQLLASVKADTQEILSILKTQPPPASTAARPHNLPPWMAPEFFIGRGAELKALCDGMDAPGALAVVQPQVVRGGGGIGKTRLAIQALWVLFLQGKCDMAFKVSADSPETLNEQIAALVERSLLNLYPSGEAPRELAQRRQDVIHALREKAGQWIILLDAADSMAARDAVNQLLRDLAGGHFLITSRRDDWPVGTVRQIPLKLFSPEEARECLRSRYWKPTPTAQELADFDRVALELGFLPLALTLAATYMGKRNITPERYLKEWNQKNSELLKLPSDDPEYDRSLMAAFQLSFSQLDAQGVVLLHLFAWLAPELFPRALVEGSDAIDKILRSASANSESVDTAKSLSDLKILSLIELDDDALELHKLTLVCARENIAAVAREGSLKATLGWIDSCLPKSEFDHAGWKIWHEIAPHLDAMVAASEHIEIDVRVLAHICNQYGLWQFHQARFVQAEPLMRRALAIDERSYGKEHPNVAIRLNNLAGLLQATNRLGEAEPLMRRGLVILVRFTSETGHVHSNLNVGLDNYLGLLDQLILSPQ